MTQENTASSRRVKVTIQTVADIAATTTVSHVINNTAKVSSCNQRQGQCCSAGPAKLDEKNFGFRHFRPVCTAIQLTINSYRT